jgi:hypothetical protein
MHEARYSSKCALNARQIANWTISHTVHPYFFAYAKDIRDTHIFFQTS